MPDEYDASGIHVIPRPENLYHLIAQIKARPGMYLESATITALKCFLDGYNFACRIKDAEERLDPPWQDFHEFVRARTGFAESTGGWCYMLLHHCDGDEEAALAVFFDMFAAFTLA
jgi:hypothetical protein